MNFYAHSVEANTNSVISSNNSFGVNSNLNFSLNSMDQLKEQHDFNSDFYQPGLSKYQNPNLGSDEFGCNFLSYFNKASLINSKRNYSYFFKSFL